MRLFNLFQGKAQAKTNAFHPYSDQLIDLLEAQQLIKPGMAGADVCTEGGALAGLFLSRGYSITLVEQDPAKHAALEHLRNTGGQLKCADPLHTGLPTGHFDFVLTERALYFERRHELRAEFNRVLRPGGRVILIADKRVYGGGLQSEAFDRLLRTHCRNYRERMAPFDIHAAVSDFFQTEPYEDALMGQQSVDLDQFLEQSRCLPIYPKPEDPVYSTLEQALTSFFAEWSTDGVLHIPWVCRLAAGSLGNSKGLAGA